MVITIKNLTLTNFKGIRSLEIQFNHVTNIFGDNAKGKTTIFDAFLWLFFGKDSTDRKDFEIKTLDAAGKPIEKIDHEVSAVIYVDDQRIEVKRILKEKWTTKRGSNVTEFTGNETLYYWNDVPLQQKEYQAKINAIVAEGVFKLITNTQYFNSLSWQERRNVLIAIAGEITDADVMNSIMTSETKGAFEELLKELNSGKKLHEYKAQISARKKKIKDDLSAIPTRIDEATRSMPEQADFAAIRTQLKTKEAEIVQIDDAIQDAVKQQQALNTAAMERNNTIHQLKTKLQNFEHEARNSFNDQRRDRETEIANLRHKIKALAEKLDSLLNEANSLRLTIDGKKTRKAGLAINWEKKNSEELVFNDSEFKCPACKRPLEANDIESKKAELQENFNKNKSINLEAIEQEGTALKEEILSGEKRLQEIENQKEGIGSEIPKLNELLQSLVEANQTASASIETEVSRILSENEAYGQVRSDLVALEAQATATTTAPVNTELREKKAGIQIQIDELKRKLVDETIIQQTKERISQLSKQEADLAQQLADLEGKEFVIEKFNRAKIDTLESRINGMFKIVRFKMFDTQINGGETECCEALINGVPFSDANNAAKINAGLDIINTLCKHYNVHAPIFIDNRESVNELIECNSQIVNLIVSRDEKLRVA